MRKLLIIVMTFALMLLCSCGSDEPAAYEPTDIQAEQTDEGMVYSVIYDIDNTDTEQWHGYDTEATEVETAINGIKACMARDDWSDDAVVYGYAKEPLLKNMLYEYGYESRDSINLYQIGIYNDTYTLQGEFD